MSPRRCALVLAPWVLLAAGCVSPYSETELEEHLAETARSFEGLGRTSVIAVHAETDMVAFGLLAEARANTDSPLSQQLGRRIGAAARRGFGVVIGGPYADLSDRVVQNALTLQREGRLPPFTLVFVSPEPPSAALARAARDANARLRHLQFR